MGSAGSLMGKLIVISDFLQDIVVWAVRFQPPHSKSNSLRPA
jgi:hypothetical protein